MKLDVKDCGCENLDSIHVAQDRFHCRPVVYLVMELRVS